MLQPGTVVNLRTYGQTPDDEKRILAKKLDLPVMVFINRIETEKPLLQFYYPNSKMPMCLHGSLVAAKFLLKNCGGMNIRCSLENGSNLEIVISKTSLIEARVGSQRFIDTFSNTELVKSLLGQETTSFISNEMPLCLSSVGSLKLLVPVSSPALLTQIHPCFDKIKQWSESSGVNGIYAYSQMGSSTFIARGFNPKGGHNEDAATGVAAAALSLSLEKSI